MAVLGDTGKLQRLYDAPTTKKIASMPLSRHGGMDKLIWDINREGTYTVKDGYELLVRQTDLTNGQSLSWNHLLRLNIPRKIAFFSWKLIHRSIHIKSTLKKRGINIQDMCPLCNSGQEDENHLFLTRLVVKRVWFGTKCTIRSKSINPLPLWTGFKIFSAHTDQRTLQKM